MVGPSFWYFNLKTVTITLWKSERPVSMVVVVLVRLVKIDLVRLVKIRSMHLGVDDLKHVGSYDVL